MRKIKNEKFEIFGIVVLYFNGLDQNGVEYIVKLDLGVDVNIMDLVIVKQIFGEDLYKYM